MSAVTFKIEGVGTGMKALRELDMKIRKRIVQAGVRAGLGEMRTIARRLAPEDTGLMKRQLSVSVKVDRVSGVASGVLKAKRTKAARRKGVKHSGHYLHLVVGGTKAHIQSGMLGRQYFSRIEHPGAKPQPFLDQAYNQGYGRAITAFENKFEERLIVEETKIRNAAAGAKA